MDNTVELLGTYGSDITHAQSAWTSTERDLDEDKLNRVDKMLLSLAKAGHHTVFEKSSLHFLVTTDIASHIHLLKHRIGVNLNAECLTGDTVITFVDNCGSSSPKLRTTLSNLYSKWSSGRPHQDTKLDAEYSRRRLQGRRIRVLNEDTGYYEHSHIKDIYKSGTKQIYKVTLDSGQILRCSGNHRVLTSNGWATISDKTVRKGVPVAINGVKTHVEDRPWTFPEFFQGSEEFTKVEFAEKQGIKYDLCKKWGYIFDIEFKQDLNASFQKGQIPWNSGVKGYTLNLTPEGKEVRKKLFTGENNPNWKGGVTKERASINSWTTSQAKKVHAKYNYCCQECGSSSNLHTHHIIPVYQDFSKGKDFDNLITVCQECHVKIHSSEESEMDFAKKVLGGDFEPFTVVKNKGGCRTGNKLKVHYSPVVSIEDDGVEETFDIEIEGRWKNFVANGIVVHNSGRYKELKEDKYYLPKDFDVEFYDNDIYPQNTWRERLQWYTELGNQMYHECLKELTPELGRKRAKESARFFKTYNSQITADIMFNWRSFAHFQKLRNDEHAQVEIREIAQKMLDLVVEQGDFPYTITAMTKAGYLPE